MKIFKLQLLSFMAFFLLTSAYQSIKAEISISNCSITPQTVLPGSTFNANCIVDNAGQTTMFGSVTYWLSTDPFLDGSDKQFPTGVTVNVPSGGSNFVSTNVFFDPTLLTPGVTSYFILMKITPFFGEDFDETNNLCSVSTEVEILPDFDIDNVSLNATTFVIGDEPCSETPNILELSFDVLNIGLGSMSNPTILTRAAWSTDPFLDPNDTFILSSTTFQPNLPPGGSQSLGNTIQFVPPPNASFTPGQSYIIIKTDYQNSEAEYSESNNITVIPITLVESMTDLSYAYAPVSVYNCIKKEIIFTPQAITNVGCEDSGPFEVEALVFENSSGQFNNPGALLGSSTVLVNNVSGNSTLNNIQLPPASLPQNVQTPFFEIQYKIDYLNVVNETNENNNEEVEIIEGTDFDDCGFNDDIWGVSTTNDATTTESEEAETTIRLEESKLATKNLDKKLKQQLKIFPNPVVNQLTVELQADEPSMATLFLFNITGQLIQQQQAEVIRGFNQFQMDCTQAKDGIYLLRINYAGQTITQKVMKGSASGSSIRY